ncbi:MAG: DEAD/DEAH box helicase [Phycisphaerae bacterium]
MTHSPELPVPKAFEELGVEHAILRALAEIHFVEPSEIQRRMIPPVLAGRDVLGQARTGTGKTAAFGLPLLQRLDANAAFQVLIVVPTRELAVQVEGEMIRFAKHKHTRIACVYGGRKVLHDEKAMERRPQVIVGTPGRILDLQIRQLLPLEQIRHLVFDEVDRMFDIGFRDDVRKIINGCRSNPQMIFVSATISDEINRMVQQHMRNPETIFTAKPEDTLTNAKAQQYYAGVNPWDKLRALKLLLAAEKPGLAIIFCRTKRTVDKVAKALNERGFNASAIHGDLMQNKRERVMRGFRHGKINILVATDLASRGIDVHEITHVINYDVPEDPEVYVHRVGRTARMGAGGKAYTFVAHGQGQMQTEIEKLTNVLLEPAQIPGFTPSPEPNRRFDGGPQQAAGRPNATGGPSSAVPVTEGYAPTSFPSTPAAPAAPRPIHGRFPTRRRR